MPDDWMATTLSGVGILLFINTLYCCIGVGGIRSLMRRLDAIEQRLTPQYIYTNAQAVPISGDPV